MSYTLIKGLLNPTLGLPDGDSIRFIPSCADSLFRLHRQASAPRINPVNGSVQLLFEGIDAIESAAAGPCHLKATHSVLELANTNHGTESAPGYIFTNRLSRDGHPIGFVFAGNCNARDGVSVTLNTDDILTSINVQQLVRGLAYPLFYDTLADNLRECMRQVSLESMHSAQGLWPSDESNDWIQWTGSVRNLPPIFPKLWRRIEAYQRDETLFDPQQPFSNFKLYIKQQANERVCIPSKNQFTGFVDLLDTTCDSVRISAALHDLVFVSG